MPTPLLSAVNLRGHARRLGRLWASAKGSVDKRGQLKGQLLSTSVKLLLFHCHRESLEGVGFGFFWFFFGFSSEFFCDYSDTHLHCPAGLCAVVLRYNSEYPLANVICLFFFFLNAIFHRFIKHEPVSIRGEIQKTKCLGSAAPHTGLKLCKP